MNNDICTLDCKTRQIYKLHAQQAIPANCSLLNTAFGFVIIGGMWSNGDYSRDASLIRGSGISVQKGLLPEGICDMACVNVNNKYIMCIGGRNSNVKRISYVLSLTSFQFVNGPLLNKKRYAAAACIHGKNIYCFGGCISRNLNDVIERISLNYFTSVKEKKKEWKYFHLYGCAVPNLFDAKLYWQSNNSIVTFGGYQYINNKIEYSCKIISVSIKERTSTQACTQNCFDESEYYIAACPIKTEILVTNHGKAYQLSQKDYKWTLLDINNN